MIQWNKELVLGKAKQNWQAPGQTNQKKKGEDPNSNN
jgi:hypothetical protein